MFKYYNSNLIISNISYSVDKICKLFKDKKLHPQTIRQWINKNNLECISRKPILIYGAVLKEFIKNRNESHKKTIKFEEMKCLKCKDISKPYNNEICIYNNKNGSIRATGICSNCNNSLFKIYKKIDEEKLKNIFFIKPTEMTLYNTSPINCKTNMNYIEKTISSESKIEEPKEVIKAQENISSNTHIKELKNGYLFDLE